VPVASFAGFKVIGAVCVVVGSRVDEPAASSTREIRLWDPACIFKSSYLYEKREAERQC